MKTDVWTKYQLPPEDMETQTRQGPWIDRQYEYRMRPRGEAQRTRDMLLGAVWPMEHEAPSENRFRLVAVGVVFGWLGAIGGLVVGFTAAWLVH